MQKKSVFDKNGIFKSVENKWKIHHPFGKRK